MSDSIRVRLAGTADAEVISEFNRRLAWETEHLRLDPATIRAGVAAVLSDAGKGLYFVAEAEGRVIGQTSITYEWSDWRNGMFWWLQSVYVDAHWRKRGVFGLILDHIQKAAHTEGAVGLRLYVERDNHVAQAVYTRREWEMTHYRIMERLLVRQPPAS